MRTRRSVASRGLESGRKRAAPRLNRRSEHQQYAADRYSRSGTHESSKTLRRRAASSTHCFSTRDSPPVALLARPILRVRVYAGCGLRSAGRSRDVVRELEAIEEQNCTADRRASGEGSSRRRLAPHCSGWSSGNEDFDQSRPKCGSHALLYVALTGENRVRVASSSCCTTLASCKIHLDTQTLQAETRSDLSSESPCESRVRRGRK